MQRATQKQRYEFIHLLMKHATVTPANFTADTPNLVTEYDVQQAALRLLHYGATLGRIAENQCNGYQTWDYKWDEKAAKRDEEGKPTAAWGFMDYQVRSFLDDLVETGKAIFIS
jgi:hypothetical protein